jgi:lipopolysaccharide transport system permease protein
MYNQATSFLARTVLQGPWRQLWRDRVFIATLVRREIEGRYRGAYGGLLWYILNNLVLLSIYSFVFGTIFRARWNIPGAQGNFSVPLFLGMIIFNVFAECISRAPITITSNANYVKRVVFPLEVLPVVSMGAALFNFFVGLLVMGCLAAVLGADIHWQVVWLPVLLLPIIALVLGLSWFLASIGVYVRDVVHIVGFVVISVMFLSPIFFPGSAFPEKFRSWMFANPMTFPIEAGRSAALQGQTPDLYMLGVMMVVGLVVAHLGYAWFQATRKGFADVL